MKSEICKSKSITLSIRRTGSSFKKFLSLILCVLMLIPSVFAVNAADQQLVTDSEAYPYFADDSGGIYAHGDAGSSSKEAWQKWESYSGINAESDVKYLFLPSISNDSMVELYNNYSDPVTVGGTTIDSQTSAIVEYTQGEAMEVIHGDETYTLKIYISDAEASLYVNDDTGTYTDCDGNVIYTDFYSFLTLNKENSVSGSGCAVTSADGISDTTLKKIKGRGNTNWKTSDKKPFNITFNSSTTVGSVTSKKFSLASNAKDSTMLRNKIMYDLADEVGSPYAPKTSYIDFYVNGVYRGCYLISQKVDLGKSSMVSLEDNSDEMDSDFSFVVEVDVWNYEGDVYFVTDRDYPVVCKTPDLDGFYDGDESMALKYEYISSTYQKFEDALYSGTLDELEQICDLDSLATAYLIQEFGKNCDGGYTSTYFTYNADEQKFYASPVWDFDSTLGAVDCVRDGCSTSTCYYEGWVTRLAKYYSTVNPLGQAFNLSGTDSEGRTFEDLCKEIWYDRFVDAIDVILGSGTSQNGALKSIDEYLDSFAQARYNNYVFWDFAWYCSVFDSGLTNSYSLDYDGEIEYLKDWISARKDWISYVYSESYTEPTTEAVPLPSNVNFYVQGVGFGGWRVKDSQYMLKNNGDGTYYIDLTLTAGTEYVFKIVDSNNSYYDPDIEDSVTASYITKSADFGNAVCTPETDTPISITLEENGYFRISYYPVGDVDEDGLVTVKDVTALQKYLVDISTLTNRQREHAEVLGDSVLDIKDATQIQRIIVLS